MLKSNFFTDIQVCVAIFDDLVIVGMEGNPGKINVLIFLRHQRIDFREIFSAEHLYN